LRKQIAQIRSQAGAVDAGGDAIASLAVHQITANSVLRAAEVNTALTRKHSNTARNLLDLRFQNDNLQVGPAPDRARLRRSQRRTRQDHTGSCNRSLVSKAAKPRPGRHKS
jgi:hypothetical protein